MRLANNSAGVVWLALSAAALAGCTEDPLADSVAVRVEATPARDTVIVGEVSTRLSATAFNVRDEAIPDATLTWRTSRPLIAGVDSLTGAVTGIAPGNAAVSVHTGSVSDTVAVAVLTPLSLRLPLDTFLLLAGDTLTIPVELIARSGAPPPITFAGGHPAIATIDPANGLVTAVATGSVAFTAHAESLTVRGGIEVRATPDTSLGIVYYVSDGGLTRRARLAARGFNHPTDDNRSAFQLTAEGALGAERLATYVLDSLTAVRSDMIGVLTENDIAAGQDAVCLPPGNWSFYRDVRTPPTITALSQSGSLIVTRVMPIAGGRAISGRFDIIVQRTDLAGAAGTARARGTFVVPVVDLATCPK